ncbi:TonB-dependent receptor domain-containing protein [Sphingomonas quercus]|uniref:TonB-dependent receptor n=1 Tax=Sphingomonas quercus TaxID=2842451 RepID=A0ABS6BF41_9SPHN|nr:TonB-dependent receptor [Sphingomonas quercus]MBU3076452.1 TonB-dependent receptor [Sphingomonas quercus]
MAFSNRFNGASALVLALSICAPAGALAQSADPAPAADATAPATAGEIVVTGSRIAISGYRQPTPVTVVSEATLQRDAKVSIGDSIRELPSVGTSGSPNNGVGANNIVGAVTGLDTVNLRQLGINRTLVLLDGQRVVQSNITGVVDLGTMPTMLVQRIDVVTGGASAAWGSDAVAGVVNLVLNKNFDGIRASIEGGESYTWDHKSYRLQAAAGTGFADGRGRVIVAVNHMNSPDAVFANQRGWNKYRNLVLNPAYTATNSEPRLIHADNVGLAQATNGGLITGQAQVCRVALSGGSCPTGQSGTVPASLANIHFVGANATPTRFNPGIVSGPLSANGDGEAFYPATNNLAVAFRTTNLFGYTYFDLSDNLRASVQLNYGLSRSKNNSTPATRFGNLYVQSDNPFLPAAIKQQMDSLGLRAIQIGTTNINNVPFDDFSYDNFVENSVGIPVSVQKRRLLRGVVSLDGKIGSDWTWNAYYQKGKVRSRVDTLSNVVTQRYNFAVDAVRDASGNIVCRAVAAGNPAAAGCVPLNVFGEGVASPQAIRYVNVTPGQNWEVISLTQDVAAASAQGKLPFGLPAGNISMAFGGEWRQEKGNIKTDAGAAARAYSFANFAPFSGKYNVKEAFLELEVPLLEDSFVDSLSLNTAGRITDYSTSGVVKTWKIGLTSQLNSLIRVRGTVSRDIRAPNLAELFNSGTAVQSSAVDPKTGRNVSVFSTTSGNADLDPEKADTFSAGVVLSPAPRLNLSLDYYSIKLKDAIFSIGTAQVLQRCNAGDTAFCSQLDFNGPEGALSQIRTFPRNLSSQDTSGLDFQVDHQLPLFGGTLSSRFLGNYILTQTQDALGVKTDYAGALGVDSPVQGIPKLRATITETYAEGPVSATIQGRFIGKGKLVNAWGEKDVDDNSVPAIFYIDLRGSYQIMEKAQLFFAVDNLLNQDPPNIATSYNNSASYYSTAVRGDIYDQLGRAYRIGVRFNF